MQKIPLLLRNCLWKTVLEYSDVHDLVFLWWLVLETFKSTSVLLIRQMHSVFQGIHEKVCWKFMICWPCILETDCDTHTQFQLLKYDVVDSAWTSVRAKIPEVDYRWLVVAYEQQNSKHQHVLRYIDIAKFCLVQFNPWLFGLVFRQSPVPTGKYGEQYCRIQYQQIYMMYLNLLEFRLLQVYSHLHLLVKLDGLGRALCFELCTLPSPWLWRGTLVRTIIRLFWYHAQCLYVCCGLRCVQKRYHGQSHGPNLVS